MSLELGQPADGDQAMSAAEAEETRSQEGPTVPSSPAASDATSAYADSGVPDGSHYSDDPDDTDEPDTTEAADTSDALDTPETEDAFASSDHEVSDADPLGAPVVPADEEAIPASGAGTLGASAGSAARLAEAAGDLDGPLLGDAAALRTNWQQILAGFVDDPREAVADAARLVDHTAQALVGALQARQRLLRAMWDRDASPGDLGTSGIGSPAGAHAAGTGRTDDAVGTEELRLLIQRYRTLFNDICP